MSIKGLFIGYGIILNKNKVLQYFKNGLPLDNVLDDFENLIKSEKLTMFRKNNDILIMSNPVLINKGYIDIKRIANRRLNIDYNTYIKFVKLSNYLFMDYEKMSDAEKDEFDHAIEYKKEPHELIIFKTKINIDDTRKYDMI